jgi:GT2 family glycosyltransferase
MALRSVLCQQDVELEVIVVDEASTDDTPAVLAGLGDARVRVVRHDMPLGASAARNRGAAEARGEWLAFLDDDDLWAPDKLARQLHAAREGSRDWVYAGAVIIDTHDRIVRAQRPLNPDEVVIALLRYDAIPGGGSNVAIRRTTWLQTGPFDTRLRNTEDWEMLIRLAKHGRPACVSSPLIARRLHSANSTIDVAEIVRGTRLIEALHHTTVDWGRLHRWMAHSCLRAGQPRTALGQFARAAVRGQGRAIASDFGGILHEKIVGRLTAPKSDRTPSDDAWIVTANGWLQEFWRSTRATSQDARTPERLDEQTSHL